MAVSTIETKKLKLMFDNGVVDGKQKYTTKTISNVLSNASDEGLLAVSLACNTLTENAVLKTKRADEYLIQE